MYQSCKFTTAQPAHLYIVLVCQLRTLLGSSFRPLVASSTFSEKNTGTSPCATWPLKTVPRRGHEWTCTTATLSSMRMGEPSTTCSGAGRDWSCSWESPAAVVLIAHQYDDPTGVFTDAFLMAALRAAPSSVIPSRSVTRKRPSAMLKIYLFAIYTLI